MVIRVKKLNNKGFAITTIVYGLSIMGILLISIIMGVVATNRQHNRELAKKISEELIRYSKTSTAFDSSVVGAQEFVVPAGQSGWYKIELWGAQGGGTKGGLGAYTSGIIELNEDDTLYFYVGRHKTTGAGGEESDVRLVSGGYDDHTSFSTRIMAAAGGGADEGADGGTLWGYNAETKPYGGQYDDDFNLISPTDPNSTTNGTLLGYRKDFRSQFTSLVDRRSAVHGLSYRTDEGKLFYNQYFSPSAEFNGGDGYISSHTIKTYYGEELTYGGSNFGGVSFIAGYGGAYPYQGQSQSANPGYVYREAYYDPISKTYKEKMGGEEKMYYFYDGQMYPGVNTGDGKARITKIFDKTEETPTLPRHNTKMNNIKFITVCADEESFTTSYSPDIMVILKGENVAHSLINQFESLNQRCYNMRLSREYEGIDEIDIWLNGIEYGTDTSVADMDYKNLFISVGGENDQCADLTRDIRCSVVIKGKSGIIDVSETRTPTGIRFSSYQFDSTRPLPEKGNYIIQPVLYENMVMTAPATADKDQNPVVVDYMSGNANQQWSIEKVEGTQHGENIYKIVDLARFKALSVKNDENKLGNTVLANREYNSISNEPDETQLWEIKPMGNGTYTIKSVLDSLAGRDLETGYLVPQTNKNKDNYNKVIIGKLTTPIVQRWKFISTDYSSSDD